MKESVERIRKDGYSEGLRRLARIVQNQQSSESVIKLRTGRKSHCTDMVMCAGIMRGLLNCQLLW